jgi:hypothetical protein
MVSAAHLLDADEEGQRISALNTQKLRRPSGTLHGEGVHDAGRALAFRAEHGPGHSVLVTSFLLHAARIQTGHALAGSTLLCRRSHPGADRQRVPNDHPLRPGFCYGRVNCRPILGGLLKPILGGLLNQYEAVA